MTKLKTVKYSLYPQNNIGSRQELHLHCPINVTYGSQRVGQVSCLFYYWVISYSALSGPVVKLSLVTYYWGCEVWMGTTLMLKVRYTLKYLAESEFHLGSVVCYWLSCTPLLRYLAIMLEVALVNLWSLWPTTSVILSENFQPSLILILKMLVKKFIEIVHKHEQFTQNAQIKCKWLKFKTKRLHLYFFPTMEHWYWKANHFNHLFLRIILIRAGQTTFCLSYETFQIFGEKFIPNWDKR